MWCYFSVISQLLCTNLLLLQGPNKKTLMSKAALTHKLRKLRSPTKCRDCEGIVVFQGVECEEVRSFWTCSSPFRLFLSAFLLLILLIRVFHRCIFSELNHSIPSIILYFILLSNVFETPRVMPFKLVFVMIPLFL